MKSLNVVHVWVWLDQSHYIVIQMMLTSDWCTKEHYVSHLFPNVPSPLHKRKQAFQCLSLRVHIT